ncbi:MAG: efflux RND transporter permease subunit [Bacteroidales bacterium]|nr:efflux RND transporter permease subunit [Bacteroidales bacterium]
MTITELSIKRPSLIIVIFGVLILAGIFAYTKLSYELMPDFSQPVLTIRTMYPGASPQEVESSVTKKIEDAVSNLENIDYISSKSISNASIVMVNFKYGADLDIEMQDAQRQIDNIKKDLPDKLPSPIISKLSVNDLPIMQISVSSGLPGTEFYQQIVDEVIPQLQQIKGVAEITFLGGEEREIQVKVDKEKLRHYKLSLLQVSEAINRASMEVPAGKVKTAEKQITVKLSGKFSSVQDIQNLVVAAPAIGSLVYLKDVAVIIDGIKETESVSRYNGQNGIGLLLKKQGDANAVDVSAAVKKQLQSIEKSNASSNIKFTIADDSTDITISAVNSVVADLGLAVLLVSLIMLLFLHSFRNSLIILVAIPASLISAFAAMWLLGYTLNLMTLLAMSLIIGILVDDSIVILENIQRFLDKGTDKRTAAIKGRAEIGFAAISITMVDVVVFLPIIFVQVFVADLLKQFSVVVVVSTLMSLLVSFTLTPWLASRMGKKEHLEPNNMFNRFLIGFENQITNLANWYGETLKWVLQHKLIFSGIIILLFAGTAGMMRLGIMGSELIATGDQGKFRLNLEFDNNTSIHENNLISREVEDFLLAQPEVKSVFSNVGGPVSGMASLGVGAENKTELTIRLKPAEERNNIPTGEYMVGIRDALQNKHQGVDFTMSTIGLVAKTAPVELTLSGVNFPLVMMEAQRLKDTLTGLPGANNVRLSIEAGNPELQIELDRDKMARYGLNTSIAGATLRNAFAGNDDATLTENGTEYTVRIWLDEFNRRNMEDVNGLTITNSMGQSVRLDQFASVFQTNAPSMLERKDRLAAVTITADALGTGSGTVAGKVVSYIENNPLPAEVIMSWGSDVKRQNDSFGALGTALLASLILVYLIMVALYDNFIYPFVVLFSIPVAAIGAFLALNLTMSNLSLFTILGMIMLLGLVAKNAILIVDFANQQKEKGMHFSEALIVAGKTRLRPILMTTTAMVFGMLPIALATGTASEWKNGLAWAIIGGLTSSMLLTVFLVPVVYYTVDSLKEKIARKTKKTA